MTESKTYEGLVLIEDSRQKLFQHDTKHKWFEEHGIKLVRSKILCGDYVIPSRQDISVDTKKDISELYGDLIQQHERFRRECIMAQDCGIKLYILVENKDGIKCVEDIKDWNNPQIYRFYKARRKALREGTKVPKPPASNVQLVKIMGSMHRDYGVSFKFCTAEESAEIIIKLLLGEET